MIPKFFILMVGAAVLLSVSIAYDICSPGESGTFYRDYSTCQGYFACSNGTTYAGSCPKDYVFNANKSACDFPRNVKCDLVCPKTGVTGFRLPNSNSCSKYIQCTKGKGTYMECSPGSLFDTKTKNCQFMDKVDCPYSNKMCPDPRISNSVASTVKCSAYYKCQKGKPSLEECESGKHFNAIKQICDTPANAKCPIVVNKTEEITDIEIECPKIGTHFFPHPMTCHAYYICHAGKISRMSCGRTLAYDFVKHLCELPTRAKCIVNELAAQKNSTNVEPYTTKPKPAKPTTTIVGF